MLLLDGHESHCNYPFIDYAWKHRILIHVLPAHSSHLTQPLDIGLFGPLQRYYGVLIAEWFKGGYPAISKADFFPLLKEARNRTYTLKNIQRAWEAAGLVPYDRRKIQSRLGEKPSTKRQSQSPARILKTPKHPQQFRQILKYSQQLVLQDGPKELIISALDKLSKSGMEGQAQVVIAQHETLFLKKRLVMKANHKKSRARIPKKHQGHAKLMNQKAVDEAYAELEAKEKLLVMKAAKKGGRGGVGKGVRNKGKTVVRGTAASSRGPAASRGQASRQASDSEG